VSAGRFFAAAALCALLLASACDQLPGASKPQFHGVDVTGLDTGKSLVLEDFNGKTRTLADFRGKVVLVTFGYTSCPDVCPTTLQDYAQAMKRLGDDASRVQLLFITVDPARDTEQRLRAYVPAFDPRFLGLRGDEKAIERVTQDFHVYAQAHPGKPGEPYTVDHASQVFAFDPQGRLRLMIPASTKPDDIASDLRILLRS
jgi:protein SCO1/2